MPSNTAIRRAATEALTIPTLRILSSAANEKERIAFVKQHIRAIEMCGRRTIQHAWLVGRELAYIKEQRADLRGRASGGLHEEALRPWGDSILQSDAGQQGVSFAQIFAKRNRIRPRSDRRLASA